MPPGEETEAKISLGEETETKFSLREETASKISLLLWFCQVLTLWFLISMLIWLCLKPQIPVYKITNIYIPALDQQHSAFLNNTEALINTSVSLNFEVSNPNKRLGIYFNDINITLYYNDAVIGTNSLTGFYQGYKKATSYGMLVNVDHQKLRRGVTSNTLEMIRVWLETTVRYQIFRSKTKHQRMYFEAYLGIGSDGRISGEKDIKLQQIVKQRN